MEWINDKQRDKEFKGAELIEGAHGSRVEVYGRTYTVRASQNFMFISLPGTSGYVAYVVRDDNFTLEEEFEIVPEFIQAAIDCGHQVRGELF